MTSRFEKCLVRAALLAGLCLVSSQATAEEAVSPARALFKEGRELAAKGDYAAACPKFEESLRLEVGVGTQFNLADCWEHIGKTASAQALFLGAAASAKAAGQADREQVLRDRAAALEPRLVRLVIETADPDPRLVIKRDDLPLEQSSLGKAVAIDPGSYVISAKAPGKKPRSKTVKVEPSSKIVTVEVPKLETAEEEKPAAKPEAAKTPPAKKELPPAADATSSDRNRPSYNYKLFALGGAGVAALAVGSVFGVKYLRANDDAKAICPTSVGCTLDEIEDHERLVDKATTSRTWAYVGFGVGTAALGTAAVLLLVNGPREQPPATGVRALPMVGERGEVGASVVGAF